jgi:flotillin
VDLISGGASAIAVIVVIVILVALVAFIASRVRRVPPNQALVIVGRNAEKSESGAGFSSPQKVIIGGRTFIWPIFQEGFTLSLEQYQTSVTAEARDANFINTAVVATVNFKVTGTEDGVRRAVQRYLLQQDALPEIVRQSLEGAIRGLIGDRPVDELVKSFSVVAQEAVNQTKNDLAELGLQIETLNVREITTPGSTYLDDRARSNAARARQIAEVAEAENKRISALAAIENDQQTAERQLELDLRRAAIKADTDRANATALAAGELAKAEQDRLVADQERTAVAAQAEVSKERLRIDVELPAEARKYATVQDAQASRDAEKAKVDVEVYQRTQNAEAAKTAAVNEAASITALGKANADAIQARGQAEAQAAAALAEAQNKLSREALQARIIASMPEIAREMAAPLANVDNMTIISADGANALNRSVAENMATLPKLLKDTTGIDVATALSSFLGSTAAGTSAGGSASGATATDVGPRTAASEGAGI